jgi:hypothetical protein
MLDEVYRVHGRRDRWMERPLTPGVRHHERSCSSNFFAEKNPIWLSDISNTQRGSTSLRPPAKMPPSCRRRPRQMQPKQGSCVAPAPQILRTMWRNAGVTESRHSVWRGTSPASSEPCDAGRWYLAPSTRRKVSATKSWRQEQVPVDAAGTICRHGTTVRYYRGSRSYMRLPDPVLWR